MNLKSFFHIRTLLIGKHSTKYLTFCRQFVSLQAASLDFPVMCWLEDSLSLDKRSNLGASDIFGKLISSTSPYILRVPR